MFSDDKSPIGFRNAAANGSNLEAEGRSLADLGALIHPREKLWFGVSIVWSVLIYLALLSTLALLIYAPIFGLVALFSQGLWLGYIRGNSVRVSETQFPEIFKAAQRICEQLNMAMPTIYIAESGGMLNAFATRFLMRDYVVLYSEIVGMAYEQGAEAVEFVVAHELAHIKRGHLKNRIWILPALFTPFLGKAYYRACEYTCDRFAAHCVPSGAIHGLLSLASGKKLYKHVHIQDFVSQVHREFGFWVWFSEVLSTHPRLPKRLAALLNVASVSQSLTVLPAPDSSYGTLSA